MEYYKNIIVGGGAAGIFCACGLLNMNKTAAAPAAVQDVKAATFATGKAATIKSTTGKAATIKSTTGKAAKNSAEDVPDRRIAGNHAPGNHTPSKSLTETLILEKTSKLGTKLLMSGKGQCNITHGGPVRDFVVHYGDKGKSIRKLLQRHSNVKLCRFMESIGVPLTEREDGKIFPSSLDSRDVLSSLMKYIAKGGVEIRKNISITGIKYDEEKNIFYLKILASAAGNSAPGRSSGSSTPSISLGTAAGTFEETLEETLACTNLIIATGGCSYPSTGSDGSMFKLLKRDLRIDIVTPKPALTPVYAENYRFGALSGVSFKDISMSVSSESLNRTFCGDLLFTHKNLSGPLILNNSRYISPGARLTFNFLAPVSGPEAIARFKRDFPGNGKSPQGYMSDDLGLPRRFAQIIAAELNIGENKVSQLSGSQIKALAAALTAAPFTVSGLAGFKEAMVTKGGISLEELDLSNMKSLKYPGLYFIGEIVDVDGDTGGYNLQFAFSSAWAAAADISRSAVDISNSADADSSSSTDADSSISADADISNSAVSPDTGNTDAQSVP